MIFKIPQCFYCNTNIIFSAQDQEFFQTKGLIIDPERCFPCRQTWKESQGNGSTDSETSYSPHQIYTVTCSDFGQQAQFSFEPRNNNPVYCTDCIEKTTANFFIKAFMIYAVKNQRLASWEYPIVFLRNGVSKEVNF